MSMVKIGEYIRPYECENCCVVLTEENDNGYISVLWDDGTVSNLKIGIYFSYGFLFKDIHLMKKVC